MRTLKLLLAAALSLLPVAAFAQSSNIPTVAGVRGWNIPSAQLAPALSGTAAGTLAAGNDSRITGALQSAAVGTTVAPLVAGMVPVSNIPTQGAVLHNWCAGGDSIIAHDNVWPGATPGSVSATNYAKQDIGIPTQVYRLTGGMYIPLSQDSGWVGDTTGYLNSTHPGILPRIQAILAAPGPCQHADGFLTDGGTNDLTAGVPVSTIEANLQTTGTIIIASGARWAHLAIPPRLWGSATTLYQRNKLEAERKQVNKVNEQWCRTQVRCTFIPLDDVLSGNDADTGIMSSSLAGNILTFTGGSTTPNAYAGRTLIVQHGSTFGVQQLIAASASNYNLKTGALAVTTAKAMTFTATTNTVTRTDGGSFLADGFIVGSPVTISGTTSNNGGGSILTMSGDGTSYTTNRTLVTETDSAATITAASQIQNITLSAPLPVSTNIPVTFNAATNTVTRTDGGNFLVDGFTPNAAVTVTGSVNNNHSETIASISADGSSYVSGTALVQETAASAAITSVAPTSGTTLVFARNGAPLPGVLLPDGLHPSPAGAVVVANRIASLISSQLGPAAQSCQGDVDNWDATNAPFGVVSYNCAFLGNGGGINTGMTGVLAENWTTSVSGSNTSSGSAVLSQNCGVANVPGGGCAQQLAVSRTGGSNIERFQIQTTVPTTRFSNGDMIYGSCRVKVDSAQNVNQLFLTVDFPGDASGTPMQAWDGYNLALSSTVEDLFDTTRLGQWLYYRTPDVQVQGGPGSGVILVAGVNVDSSQATAGAMTAEFAQCGIWKDLPGAVQ